MSTKLENAKSLYMEGIRDGNAREAVTKYTGDRYTQHSTGVRDGIEGFVEFFEPFIKRNPKREIEIVRGWEDGQYVFLQAYQNINDGEAQWVTTDFFDTDENDKIIEHWDVISAYTGSTPSGHTEVDGPTEVTDLDKTEENKALVRNLIQDALMVGGDPSRIPEYVAKEYIQHNKEVPDGREHFLALATAPNRPLNYKRIVLLVGQGNFVATLCEANWNDGTLNQDYAQVDIFRIQNGKVVEHWDNVEPVPENDVNGGKF
ncbi:MAG: nuclear transport factor 2 family protein [Bacteroidota bacterium]